MSIIEKLKYHEEDKLNDWVDYSEKRSRKFLKEIVHYSKDNFEEIRTYCNNTIPKELSSLSIVYEALSEYSTNYNDFLSQEVQRVVNLAKNGTIKATYLEVLTDIETEDIYSKTEDIYIKTMNFLIANLHLENDNNFNIQLLEIIDWYLIELDEDDDIKEASVWINQIKNLANNGSSSVKIKAREVLNNSEISVSLNPLSVIEKIKSLF